MPQVARLDFEIEDAAAFTLALLVAAAPPALVDARLAGTAAGGNPARRLDRQHALLLRYGTRLGRQRLMSDRSWRDRHGGRLPCCHAAFCRAGC
jgi:hypothetical protein